MAGSGAVALDLPSTCLARCNPLCDPNGGFGTRGRRIDSSLQHGGDTFLDRGRVRLLPTQYGSLTGLLVRWLVLPAEVD